MNGNGSYSLSDHGDPVVVVMCERCNYRERYNKGRLMAAHGDLPMPSVLTIIAKTECHGRNRWGGCGLVYERPLARLLVAAS